MYAYVHAYTCTYMYMYMYAFLHTDINMVARRFQEMSVNVWFCAEA